MERYGKPVTAAVRRAREATGREKGGRTSVCSMGQRDVECDSRLMTQTLVLGQASNHGIALDIHFLLTCAR